MFKPPTSQGDSECQEGCIELAAKLASLVNRFDNESVGFRLAEGFLRQHRTLQQQAFSALMRMIDYVRQEIAENELRDMRNEVMFRHMTDNQKIIRDMAVVPFI